MSEKKWVCVRGHLGCRDRHHQMASNPRWQGKLSMKGHDSCGWLDVPEWGDKTFFDQIRELVPRGDQE